MRTAATFLLLLIVLASKTDAAIVVSKITPDVGPSTGGTEIRLEGSGFFGGCVGAPCEERSLAFGGVPAVAFHVLSDTLAVATTPAQSGVHYVMPVVAIMRVGSEQGSFSFYYSDLVRTPVLDELERVLLPAYNCYLPGAHGSEWCSTLSAFNSGDERAVFYPVYPGNVGTEIGALALPPRRIVAISLLRSTGSFTEAAPVSARVLYVEPNHVEDLNLNLRLFDRSRTAMTWGTDVPVVREQDLFDQTIQLFPVPLASRFRATLRIYDPMRTPDATVSARFFRVTTGDLLATRVLDLVALTLPINGTVHDFSYPGLAEIANLAELPELQILRSEESVRIEIEPVTPNLRFWAMVSVTNDETQHVTLVTPAGTPRQEATPTP